MPASRLIRAALSSAPAWSDPLVARRGLVYAAASGTFAGKLTIERSHDDGAAWETADVLLPGWAPRHIENAAERAWFRIGFAAAGDRTSGSADVELAQ